MRPTHPGVGAVAPRPGYECLDGSNAEGDVMRDCAGHERVARTERSELRGDDVSCVRRIPESARLRLVRATGVSTARTPWVM